MAAEAQTQAEAQSLNDLGPAEATVAEQATVQRKPRIRPLVFTVLGAILIAAIAVVPNVVGFALALILVVGFALGWGRLVLAPAPAVPATTALLAGIVAVLVVAIWGDLNVLPLVVGVGVVLAFVGEMRRNDQRPELLYSLSASVSGVAIAVSAGCLPALALNPAWRAALIPTALLLLAAAMLSRIPGRAGRFAPITLLPILGAAFGFGVGATGHVSASQLLVLNSLPPELGTVPGAALAILLGILGLMIGATFTAFLLVISEVAEIDTTRSAVSLGTAPILIGCIVAYGLVRTGGI